MPRDVAEIIRLGAGSDLEELWHAVERWAEARETWRECPGDARLAHEEGHAADLLLAAYTLVLAGPGEAETAALERLRELEAKA